MSMKKIALLLSSIGVLLSGCAVQQPAVNDEDIRSVLVVPVVNETSQVGAELLMSAYSTTPLAEHGYYVYPVDTVKMVLEAEGLYEPERVQQTSPAELAKMFSADSVLFIKITYWDAQYILLNTKTQVHATYTLYKADGTQVWSDTIKTFQDSSGNSGSLIGLIIDAAMAAVSRAAPDFKPVARLNNALVVNVWAPGPYAKAK